MRVKNHTIVPLEGGNGRSRLRLSDTIKMSLINTGYDVLGEPVIVNYHEAYAAVAQDGGIVGSAWIITLSNEQLILSGGLEGQLEHSAAKELCNPGRDFISSLTTNQANREWRSACMYAASQSETVFARGSIIKPRFQDIITHDNSEIGEMVITDGQRGHAYTSDGRKVRYPRIMKDVADLLTSFDGPVRIPITINAQTVKSAVDRRIAASLAISDLAQAHAGDQLYGYQMQTKTRDMRMDSETLLFKIGDRLCGTISGTDAIAVAKAAMDQINRANGHVLKSIQQAQADITIDQTKFNAVLQGMVQKEESMDYSPMS